MYRVRQGIGALLTRGTVDDDAVVTAALSPDQAAAFRALPAYDQAHLCRVYRALRREGADDPDLLVAALLHDLGKIEGGHRVRLIDRVARVLLARLAPRLLAYLAGRPAPRWRRGLALAVHHPALGAARAAKLGCSPRTCWLIRRHEDNPAPDDADLHRLIAADKSVP